MKKHSSKFLTASRVRKNTNDTLKSKEFMTPTRSDGSGSKPSVKFAMDQGRLTPPPDPHNGVESTAPVAKLEIPECSVSKAVLLPQEDQLMDDSDTSAMPHHDEEEPTDLKFGDGEEDIDISETSQDGACNDSAVDAPGSSVVERFSNEKD